MCVKAVLRTSRNSLRPRHLHNAKRPLRQMLLPLRAQQPLPMRRQVSPMPQQPSPRPPWPMCSNSRPSPTSQVSWRVVLRLM